MSRVIVLEREIRSVLEERSAHKRSDADVIPKRAAKEDRFTDGVARFRNTYNSKNGCLE